MNLQEFFIAIVEDFGLAMLCDLLLNVPMDDEPNYFRLLHFSKVDYYCCTVSSYFT
jgi:hypothetical protein